MLHFWRSDRYGMAEGLQSSNKDSNNHRWKNDRNCRRVSKDLPIKEARKKIIEDLKKEGLLIAQKPIKHFVNVHERCGTEIEFVKSKQWFVKYLDLKKDLIKWGKELKWYPDFMRHRYENWVNGLQWDWLDFKSEIFWNSYSSLVL